MKYIAKPNTWFKEGTECKLIEYLYDSAYTLSENGKIQQEDKHGIFEGIRICEDGLCEGGINKETGKPYHENGKEYHSNEICSYSEFEIIEEEKSFMPIYYTEEELDDLVSKWHKGSADGAEIYEYLGVSKEEYAKWMTNQSHKLLKPLVTFQELKLYKKEK